MNIERIESGPSFLDKTATDYEHEAAAREAAWQHIEMNRALNIVRSLNLDADMVRQILQTLSCRMVACGMSDEDVSLIDYVSDAL